MPFSYTAGLLAALGGVLVVCATSAGPETRGGDLETVGVPADTPLDLAR